MPAGHAINLTPSANLLCEIPEDVTGSLYTGQIYVGIKDAIFEASDPLRHIVELLSVLGIEEGINALSPYLVLFSGGGGGHNLTFLYVQCVLLALFKIGNFDILDVGGCAPNQSYINPAERCMSLLNTGLQGLSLQQHHVGKFEKMLTSCKTMKAIREKAQQQHGLKEGNMTSM